MKRQFTVPGPTAFYDDLVGGAACRAKPSACDLSRGVVADNRAGTVTFNLTAADPEFLDKLSLPFAFAVPGDTSLKNTGDAVPPGTGPYEWKSYDPRNAAVLVRNPYFKQWSAEAQPQGNPASIVVKFGMSTENEVTQVENGQADVMSDQDLIPPDRQNEISTKFARHVHVQLLTADEYFALNTRVPPFNNVKARQAANFAADRQALIIAAGGPSVAAPSCQILPPNFPGYRPYCPYTAGTSTRHWSAPDLARARLLVKASHTEGDRVAVYGTTGQLGEALTTEFASDLNKIGYHATVRLLAPAVEGGYVQDSADKAQAALSSWYQDYPAASDFIRVLLSCGAFRPRTNVANPNLAEFCNGPIDSEITRAAAVENSNVSQANRLWAQVDRQITDLAPWVTVFNPKQIDFEAARVHGYAWSPEWYTLLDQLWIGGR